MQVRKYRISIFSANPENLMKFYTVVLGFKLLVSVDRADDYGFGIEVAPGYKLWIAKHSEVRGKSTEPFRHMLSLYVDDIQAYFDAVRRHDAELIVEDPTLTCSNIPGEERWAGSFLDPDGNCVQVMAMTGK